jgi:hypothetical protein
MDGAYASAVILVCTDAVRSVHLIERLSQAGIHVLGPARTASMALAIAAQTPVSLAIVDQPPTGRRKIRELAHALMADWGVRTLLLNDLGDDRPSPECVANPKLAAKLKGLLNGRHGSDCVGDDSAARA